METFFEPCPLIANTLGGSLVTPLSASMIAASTTRASLLMDVQPVDLVWEGGGGEHEGVVTEREPVVQLVAVPLGCDDGGHRVPDGERQIDPELQAVILERLAEADVAAPLPAGAGREPRVADCVQRLALDEEHPAAARCDLVYRPLLLELDHVAVRQPVEGDLRILRRVLEDDGRERRGLLHVP